MNIQSKWFRGITKRPPAAWHCAGFSVSRKRRGMRASVTVRVAGSTSNLGAGFDCVGVAVGRWLQVTAQATRGGKPVVIERGGTLCALDTAPEADLLYRGFAAACRRAGQEVPAGLALAADSDIPIARGLGSSAAATVAGAAAAAALLDLAMDAAGLVELCSELEGHADNVAPAVFGGANLVLRGPDGLIVTPLPIHPSLALVFAVPDFTVETKRARAALPATLPHADAVRAARRAPPWSTAWRMATRDCSPLDSTTCSTSRSGAHSYRGMTR